MFNENDVKIVKGGGPVVKFLSFASSTVIYAGHPVKVSTKYAVNLATDAPKVGTDVMLGVTHKQATHSSTVDGVVEVTTLIPNKTVVRWNAETPSRVNTQSQIDALLNNWITCDLNTGVFTINEDDANAYETNGLGVIGGDPVEGTLDVFVNALCTFAAPNL